MKNLFRLSMLVFLMSGVFVFTSCQKASEEQVEQTQQEEVLEDVQLEENQTIPDMVEDKVDDFDDQTEQRSEKYGQVMGEPAEDDF